jgi:tetratricopeptide (TPR) repeat protein
MTSETPRRRVPRVPSKPSSVPRPPSSPLINCAVQLPGQRPDELARWWSQLAEAALLLHADNAERAAAGAARLSRELEQAVENGVGGAEEPWALLGSARTVLGLACEEQSAGERAQRAYAAAVDAFGRAGSLTAGRGDVAAYLGRALLGADRPAEAAEVLRRAASELGEDTPDVRRGLGLALAHAGRLADAEKVLLDAVARAPYDWRAQHALATTGEQLGRSAEDLSARWAAAAAALPDPHAATAAYERARDYSTTADTVLALGVSYAAIGRTEDAERTLREADKLRPSARTRLYIADVVAVRGDTDEAAAVAASAVPLGVEDATILVGLGAHLLAADRLDEFDRVTDGLPPALMAVVDVYRGIGLIQRNRVAEGTALLNRVLPAVPPNERLLLTVAATAVDADQTDLAMSVLDRILQIDPAEARTLAVRGTLRLQTGMTDAAESDLRSALDREPGLGSARAYLGDLLRLSGRFAEADAHLRRAVDDGADEAWVLASRAEAVLLGAGPNATADAESLYRQALERDPDLLAALCGLAMMLLDQVDPETQREVSRLLERALRVDAESPLATTLQGEVLRRDGRTVEALEHLERALDEDSEWVWGLGTWAQALHTRYREDGDRRHLEKAKTLLTRAVSLSPDLPWLRGELAEVHLDLEEPLRALDELQIAAKQAPDDPGYRLRQADVHAEQAESYLAMGKPDRALAELRIAAKKAPDEPKHLIRQAQLHAGEGDLHKAERVYRRVLDLAEDYPGVRTQLADVLWQRWRNQEAMDVLDAALSVDPDDHDARYLRYRIHWDERRLAEAVTDLDYLADHGEPVQVARADAHRLQGRYAEAGSLLDEVLATDPRDAAARGVRGVLEWAQGDVESALADLEEAVVASPDDEFVVGSQAHVLLALGRGREAQRRLVQLKADEKPHLLPIYADVLSRTGRQEEAVQLLERALWSGPDDVRPLAALGSSLAAMERDTEAIACFRRIVDLRPGELDRLCDLATALEHSGDLAEALTTVAKVVEERPGDPLGWQIRSKLQASMGDFDPAVESATAATGCLQQMPEAYEALGSALLYSAAPGRAEAALAAYRRARELDALNPWVRSGEADALHLLGDERHRQLNRETIELTGRFSYVSPDLLGLRGWCLFRMGEFDRALTDLLRAVSLTIRPARMLFDLVLVVLATEALPDARTFFRRAVEELHQEPKLAQRGLLHVARRDLHTSRPDLPAAVHDVADQLSRQLEKELAELEKRSSTA